MFFFSMVFSSPVLVGKGGKAAQSCSPLRFPAEIDYGYCNTTNEKVKER